MDEMSMAPKSSSSNNSTMMMSHKMQGMIHMTLFWGKDSLILFNNWPAGNTSNYVMALFMIFIKPYGGRTSSDQFACP